MFVLPPWSVCWGAAAFQPRWAGENPQEVKRTAFPHGRKQFSGKSDLETLSYVGIIRVRYEGSAVRPLSDSTPSADSDCSRPLRKKQLLRPGAGGTTGEPGRERGVSLPVSAAWGGSRFVIFQAAGIRLCKAAKKSAAILTRGKSDITFMKIR